MPRPGWWTRLSESDHKLIRTWIKVHRRGGRPADVAKELARTRVAVTSRAAQLRYFGIDLPRFQRGRAKPDVAALKAVAKKAAKATA